MKKIFILIILLLISSAYGARTSAIWKGPFAKQLPLNGIEFNDNKRMYSGSVDPTAVAVDADIGSIYAGTNDLFKKLDNGSTTNWIKFIVNFALVGGTQGAVTFLGPSGFIAEDPTQFFWNDTSNKLSLGTDTAIGKLTISGAGSLNSMVDVYAYAGNPNFMSSFRMRRANGSEASPARLQVNEMIGSLEFGAHNGIVFVEASAIDVSTVEDFSAVKGSTKMEFYVSPTGPTYHQLALTINPDQSADFTNNLSVQSENELRLNDADNSDYIGFKAPSALTGTTTFTLPDGDGSSGDKLGTNGAGTLVWSPTFFNEVGYLPANEIEDNGTVDQLDDLQKVYNIMYSSGVMYQAGITDNGDGTIDIAAGQGIIRATADPHSKLFHVSFAAQAGIALTNNSINYVYWDYNAGSPTFVASTSESSFNCIDKCLAYVISREGNDLTIIDAREQNVDGNRKTRRRFLHTRRYEHKEVGTAISETGTRNLALTSGSFYFMMNELNHDAFDTSIAGTANVNVFVYYYYDGAAWVKTANSKQIDNTQYNDIATGLTALSGNRYKTEWIYLVHGTPTSFAVLYSQDQYLSVAAAQAAPAPSILPAFISGTGSLVGRVIIKNGDAAFTLMETAFGLDLSTETASNHNNLSGLQGGTTDEYYHVTNTAHGNLSAQDQQTYIASSPTFAGATISGLTASQFVVTNGSKQLASQASISLTADVSGILPPANGGTGIDSSALTGIPRITAGVWSASAINLATSDVTGTLAVANGGTGSSTALGNSLVMESVGGAIVESTTTSSELDLLNSRTYIPNSVGTNNQVATFDGTNSTDSTANFLNNDGAVDILGDLDVDNLNLNGNTISSSDVNGDVVIDPNGTGSVNLPDLTVSQPAYINASGDLVSQDISLTADVSGTLPVVNGGEGEVSTQSASYTVLDTDNFSLILVDDTSTDRTITLPTASANTDRVIGVKNISTDQGKVTVEGEVVGETIDGFVSIDLDFKNSYIYLKCDGSDWFIVAENVTGTQKTYVPTVSGTNWTTTSGAAFATPYRSLDGQWHVKFRVSGTLSIAAARLTVNMTEVTWKTTNDMAISGWQNNVFATRWTDLARTTGTDQIDVSVDTASTGFIFAGDVALSSKPDFVE